MKKPGITQAFSFGMQLNTNMALISFKDWRLSLGESSPHTRWRDGWQKGNYPGRADVASRSTPSPAAWEKAEEELGSNKKKHKKKKKKED